MSYMIALPTESKTESATSDYKYLNSYQLMNPQIYSGFWTMRLICYFCNIIEKHRPLSILIDKLKYNQNVYKQTQRIYVFNI